jgi:hypothetical protein
MTDWEAAALNEVWLGRMDPDHVPRYRVPARPWWQFWKPRWMWVSGVSVNQIRRVHGLELERPAVRVKPI